MPYKDKEKHREYMRLRMKKLRNQEKIDTLRASKEQLDAQKIQEHSKIAYDLGYLLGDLL